MVQEIIVYLIGIAVAILLVSKIYKAFFSKKEKRGFTCSSCNCSTNAKYIANPRSRN